ncbi:MAG TPA: aminotransferase class I/II-fold pyridoxal phosphate-dependent enzyme [Bacilli bacterium]|nr:aminotransferase class I/II-fold pyridoxal phosphate-dependent enzyme [Bacilli bacterium]HOR53438.1 aminotransferase class I/II-fold pyridoxal phosphate-dependent enzyme [Bacilli bacterium]
MKYSFLNDYNTLAHPEVFKHLQKYVNEVNEAYGLDEHSKNAKRMILEKIGNNYDVHFLVGGTSANKIVLSHFLKPYEAIICPESAHINRRETGAVEANGHKILVAKSINGKITLEGIKEVLVEHNDEHAVMPRIVSISYTTEYGTVYTKKELEDIAKLCKENNLFLYVDGARLVYGLAASNLSLKEFASIPDAFTIGGTKAGAMLGEAVVIKKTKDANNFRYSIKQNGGMLAKGFLAGLQFEVLFTNDLLLEICKDANQKAVYLRDKMKELNIKFLFESDTNLQFPILSNKAIKVLKEKYLFSVWNPREKDSVVRFVTTYGSDYKVIDQLIEDLRKEL